MKGPNMRVKDIVDDIAHEAGWNETSIIVLLCEFINSRRLGVSLKGFLAERASEEAKH
jgi:hypothetical protein